MTNMRGHRRLAAAAAASLALALGASGCAFLSPVQTHEFYQASDGTNGMLRPEEGGAGVKMRNAQLIVDEDGRAEFSAFFGNDSAETQTVSIDVTTLDGTTVISQSIEIPAHQSLTVGPNADESIGQDDTTAQPGDYAELVLSGQGMTEVTINLPVNDTSLGYPEDITSDS